MEMSGEAGRLAMSTDAVAGAAIVAATVAGMKMEFPGPSPVFGHGFSPPVGGLVLDLSSSKHPSGSSLPFSAVTVDGQEPNADSTALLATVRIKQEVKSEEPPTGLEPDEKNDETCAPSEEMEDDAAPVGLNEMDGCSRTVPWMPEAWRRQQQEQRLQVIQPSASTPTATQIQTATATVASKTCGKAVIRKTSPSLSPSSSGGAVPPANGMTATPAAAAAVVPAPAASSTIPVGIAVARQRSEKSRRRSGTPPCESTNAKQQRRMHSITKPSRLPHPQVQQHLPSPSAPSPSELFITGGSPLPPTLPLAPPPGINFYNPAGLFAGHSTAAAATAANWAWPSHHSAALDHLQQHYGAAPGHHSYWPPTPTEHHMNPLLSYPAYPTGHHHHTGTGTAGGLHHHHHHHSSSGLTPSPLLLIPAACLDPYQRAAAAMLWPAGYSNPPQSPWSLGAEHPPTPLTPWSMSRSPFELPSLRPEVSAVAPVTPLNGADPDDVKPVVEECQQNSDIVDPVGIIKEERNPSPTGTPPPASLALTGEIGTCLDESNESLDMVSVDPPDVSGHQPEQPVVGEAPSFSAPEFSGLQLLSDVTADQARQSEESPGLLSASSSRRSSTRETAAGNSLDVLCAAALSQHDESASCPAPKKTLVSPPPPSTQTSKTDVVATATPVTSTSSHAVAHLATHAFHGVEFDFRCKLAELQRKYKEKQKELSSLRCKRKDGGKSEKSKEKRNKDKKRRRSSAEAASAVTPPADEHHKKARRRDSSSSSSSNRDNGSVVQQPPESTPGAPPPPLSPSSLPPADVTKSSTGTVSDFFTPGRLDVHASPHQHHPDLSEDEVKVEPRIATSYAAALASAAVSSSSPSSTTGSPLPNSAATHSALPCLAEKKKRKPDFPVRKPDAELTSETIVPLSKKRKFFQLFQWCHSSTAAADSSPPPPSNGDVKKSKKKNNSTTKKTSIPKPKIKPKLKAEVQVKRITSSSSSASSGDEEEDDQHQVGEVAEDVLVENESERLEQHCLPALQLLQLSDDSGAEVDAVPSPSPVPLPPTPQPAPVSEPDPVNESYPTIADNSPWLLSQELLKDGLRVLIAEDGLFRGGSVTGIRPPDIYGVLVDGERCSRPRILSTEELLNDALLEVKPAGGLGQLPIGTRVCAYWSPKSRCLYPGVVSNVYPATPSTGHKNVTREDEIDVEFDDGDSGRIPISQIRVLPPDYPITEMEPNQLDALERSRRKRRISSDPVSIPPFVPFVPFKPSIQHDKEERKEDETLKTQVDPELKMSKKSKKHKKKHKKRSKCDSPVPSDQDQGAMMEQNDMIIPVSPGLTIDPTVEEDEDDPIKMDTKSDKEEMIGSSIVSPRRAKPKTPEMQRKNSSKSKMAAFLPERQLWQWMGPSFKRASKGKGRKEFYKAIQRGDEIIRVGDCAVFLSAGRPDRPYVGRVEQLWQSWGGSMTVKVRWFYHPEETCGGRRLAHLKIPGALFESNHVDENDVQTISHCCTVSSLETYTLSSKPDVNLNVESVSVANPSGYDQFYLAGFYDPTSGHLSFEPGVLDPHKEAVV